VCGQSRMHGVKRGERAPVMDDSYLSLCTGTGKTALAYIASRYYLDEGQRVILTAPTKELVKSLYREASGIWGAKVVGLNTENDRNVRDRFFIVSTPEGLISAIRTNKEWTKAGLLIIDEAHNSDVMFPVNLRSNA
jgi:replicative superfamily II helicase